MGDDNELMEQVQEQELLGGIDGQKDDAVTENGISFGRTGGKTFMDESVFGKIGAIRQTMMLVEAARNEPVQDMVVGAAKGFGKEVISAPDQNIQGRDKYKDLKQSEMSKSGKFVDAMRSFGALFGNRDRNRVTDFAKDSKKRKKEKDKGLLDSAESTNQNKEAASSDKPERGHFARSMEMARTQIIDTGNKGFFSKLSLGFKALFGKEIKEKQTNYKFNNHLELGEVEVTQATEGDNRMFKVTAGATVASLVFSEIKLLKGLGVNINIKGFNYVYDISNDNVKERDLSLFDFSFTYGEGEGALVIDVKGPKVIFDLKNKNSIDIFADSCSVKLPSKEKSAEDKADEGNSNSASVSGITGKIEKLMIGSSGLKWEKATLGIGNANMNVQAGDVALGMEAEGIELSVHEDPETKVRKVTAGADKVTTKLGFLDKKEVIGAVTNFRYDDLGWSFGKIDFTIKNATMGDGLKVNEATFTVISNNNPQQPYKYAFEVKDLGLHLGPLDVSLGGISSEVQQLEAIPATDNGQIELPSGWQIDIKKIENLKIASSEESKQLADLGMSVNLEELMINTRENKGSITKVGFTASAFGKAINGNAEGIKWTNNSYEIGKWSAGVEAFAIGKWAEVGASNFEMDKQGEKPRATLSMAEGGIHIPDKNSNNLKVSATKVKYDFYDKKLNADTVSVGVNIADNSVEVDITSLSITEKDGIKIAQTSTTVKTQDFSLLDDHIKVKGLTFGLETTGNEISAVSFGGSLGLNIKGQKIDAETKGLLVKMNLKNDEITGKISSLKLTLFGITGETGEVAFTNNSFSLKFLKSPDVSSDFPVESLLSPGKAVSFACSKLFDKVFKLKLPDIVKYNADNGFEFEYDEDQEIEKNKVHVPFFDGDINAADPESSPLKMNVKLPSKFDSSTEDQARKTSFELNAFKFPLLTTGIFNVWFEIGARLGASATSNELKPKKEKDGDQTKIKINGDYNLGFAALASIGVSAHLGEGVGLGAYAKALAGVVQPNTPAQVNIELVEDESSKDGFKFGGSNYLDIPINTTAKATIVLGFKVMFFGKGKNLGELKLYEKDFGTLTGGYRFNFTFDQNTDTKERLQKTAELVFTPKMDPQNMESHFEADTTSYDAALETADTILFDKDNPKKIPRTELIDKAKKAKDVVKLEIGNTRSKNHLVVKELANYAAKESKNIDKYRKFVKKHKLRIENEESLQTGLSKWDPDKQIVPTYEVYDLSLAGLANYYIEKVQEITNKIGATKNAYDKGEYLTLGKNLLDLYKTITDIAQNEKPPRVKIEPGKAIRERYFYKTMFGKSGDDIYIEQQKKISKAKDSKNVVGTSLRLFNRSLTGGVSLARWEYGRDDESKLGADEATGFQFDLLNKLSSDRSTKGRVGAQVLRNINNKDYEESLAGGAGSGEGGNSYNLTASMLEEMYSSNAINEARKSINDDYDDADDVNKELLLTAYVRKHTASRIQAYTSKIDNYRVNINSYDSTIKMLNEREKQLQNKESELEQMLTQTKELVLGDSGMLQSVKDTNSNISESKAIAKKNNIESVATATQGQKNYLDNVLSQMEALYNSGDNAIEASEDKIISEVGDL